MCNNWHLFLYMARKILHIHALYFEGMKFKNQPHFRDTTLLQMI